MGLKPSNKAGHYYYSALAHPIGRVLKFRRILQYLEQVPKGGAVLDYGAGDRPYEELLLKHFEKYIAADHRLANLSHSRRPDVYIDDAEISIDAQTADCIIVTEVLEHVYTPGKTLRSIFKALRPGGHVLGSVPFVIHEHEVPFDFHRYTYFCLERMFQDAGFKIIRLDYIGDTIAVMLTVSNKLMDFIPKVFTKCRLQPIAHIANLLLRLPQLAYIAICGKRFRWPIHRIHDLPLGFTFHLQRVADPQSSSVSAPQ